VKKKLNGAKDIIIKHTILPEVKEGSGTKNRNDGAIERGVPISR
jgi:hypothetical protein